MNLDALQILSEEYGGMDHQVYSNVIDFVTIASTGKRNRLW